MTQPALQDRTGQRVPDVSLRIRSDADWASVTTDAAAVPQVFINGG